MQSEAIVQTAHARRYLGQFCKHFAHKAPVELDPALASGQVRFGAGICSLYADEAALTLKVEGEAPDLITTLQDVVARHLIRFAFREDLTLAWQTPG
jgi:hypothetical protein